VKIAVEWIDADGKLHLKILSQFAAEKYISYLKMNDIEVSHYAA
jgi:hypothetical protein